MEDVRAWVCSVLAWIWLMVGVTLASVVDKLTAKSRILVVPAWKPPEADQLAEEIPSKVVWLMPLVSMLAKVEVCQAEPSQYFQVVRPSKETRYLRSVLVGVVWVVVTLSMFDQADTSSCDPAAVVM